LSRPPSNLLQAFNFKLAVSAGLAERVSFLLLIDYLNESKLRRTSQSYHISTECLESDREFFNLLKNFLPFCFFCVIFYKKLNFGGFSAHFSTLFGFSAAQAAAHCQRGRQQGRQFCSQCSDWLTALQVQCKLCNEQQ